MTAADFRRIALSFEGAEESSHMGSPDFRIGGRIFATLAHKPRAIATSCSPRNCKQTLSQNFLKYSCPSKEAGAGWE